MKTNELRIGNWVSDEGDYCKITMIQDSYVHYNFGGLLIQGFSEDIEPILITQEWLLRFGFRSESQWDGGKVWFNIDLKDKNTLSINNDQNTYCVGCEEWSEWTFPSSLNYVHQLQNLYFALTGEELQLK